jgi:murein DD-endopeptidase MepM/ murein hydrolase activator NlpD
MVAHYRIGVKMRFYEFSVMDFIPGMSGLLKNVPSNVDSAIGQDFDPMGNTTGAPSSGSGKPVDARPGSPFGPRNGRAHNGTDFPVPVGTPVKAPQDGVITKTGNDRMNGIHVVIRSGDNEHFLLHLSKINVSNGQRVKQGDVVALSGNTGHSTGPHLHWEKHVAGRPVDPTKNMA